MDFPRLRKLVSELASILDDADPGNADWHKRYHTCHQQIWQMYRHPQRPRLLEGVQVGDRAFLEDRPVLIQEVVKDTYVVADDGGKYWMDDGSRIGNYNMPKLSPDKRSPISMFTENRAPAPVAAAPRVRMLTVPAPAPVLRQRPVVTRAIPRVRL